MKRPEVAVSNYKAVYDFYQDFKPNPIAAWVMHRGLGLVFAPKIVYAEEAEEQIQGISGPLVLASNHVRAVDPCVIAALPMRTKTLRTLVGTSFIPSKSPIQKSNKVVHRGVDVLGAVPIFKPKYDTKAKDGPEAASPSYRSAGVRAIKTFVAKLEAGENMVIFPEGTRNTDNPNQVQRLEGGIASIICRVSHIPQPPIVPMAIRYSDSQRLGRSPLVYIGRPSSEPFTRPSDVMSWLGVELQDCVNNAVQARDPAMGYV